MTRKFKEVYKKYKSKLYCPRNKITGEYIDGRYNNTEDIAEAVGWETKDLCIKGIQEFDEPNEWEISVKFTDIIVGKLLEE